MIQDTDGTEFENITTILFNRIEEMGKSEIGLILIINNVGYGV